MEKTRSLELAELIDEAKAEIADWIEELASKDTTQNNIDRAKQFLMEAIERKTKYELELSKLGGC